MPKCFECRSAFPFSPLMSEGRALCLRAPASERVVVDYEDNGCRWYEENPLVAYALDKAYQEGQKAAGPTERQWNGAMGQAFDEGVREGGER